MAAWLESHQWPYIKWQEGRKETRIQQSSPRNWVDLLLQFHFVTTWGRSQPIASEEWSETSDGTWALQIIPFSNPVPCCLSLEERAFQKLTVFYGVLLNSSWNFPGQILICSLSFQTAEKWHSTGHGSTTFSTSCSLTSSLPFHMHPPWRISRKKGRGQRNSTVGKLKCVDK